MSEVLMLVGVIVAYLVLVFTKNYRVKAKAQEFYQYICDEQDKERRMNNVIRSQIKRRDEPE